jgi:hypothetical protein
MDIVSAFGGPPQCMLETNTSVRSVEASTCSKGHNAILHMGIVACSILS